MHIGIFSHYYNYLIYPLDLVVHILVRAIDVQDLVNILFHFRCNVHATPKKKQTCKVCLNTFGTRAELKLHTDRVHKDNAFSCDMCGKTIVIEATLKDHMDSHSGEKRYVCQCGKTYRYNSNLSRHQQKCSAKRQS